MKRKASIILILLLLFLYACSNRDRNSIPKEIVNLGEGDLQQNQELKLPEGFTRDKIEDALLEYINYRLWWYPAETVEDVSGKAFDNYIGKSIDVEIRIYKTDLGESVYAHTSVGQWLAVLEKENEFVYCDGLVSEDEYGWPNNTEDYTVFEKFSIVIPQPRKPNYGTSERKDKMIDALEAAIKVSCEDFYNGADRYHDEWINVDIYIVDFYEYENAAHALLYRQDGSTTYYPVAFEEVNNEFKVQTIKGYTVGNGEFARVQFEKDIEDAVRHFKWNPK